MQRMGFRTREEAESYDGNGNPVYEDSGLWFIGKRPLYDPGRAQPISAPEPQPGGFPPVPQMQPPAGIGKVTPTSPGMPYGTIGQDGRIDYGPGVFAPPQVALPMPAYGPRMY